MCARARVCVYVYVNVKFQFLQAGNKVKAIVKANAMIAVLIHTVYTFSKLCHTSNEHTTQTRTHAHTYTRTRFDIRT